MSINISVGKKKLGVGAYGTVYQAKFNKEPSVVKIEPVKPDDNLIEQEKQFALAVKNKPGFLKLVSCGYVMDCETKQPVPGWLGAKERAWFRKKNNSPMCAFVIYQPQLSGQITNEMLINNPKIMRQMYDIIITMRNLGWAHNDIHIGNWMTDRDGTVYLIDYGLVSKGSNYLDFTSLIWMFYSWEIPKNAKFNIQKITRSVWWKSQSQLFEKMTNKNIKQDMIGYWTMLTNPDLYISAWDKPIKQIHKPNFKDISTISMLLSYRSMY